MQHPGPPGAQRGGVAAVQPLAGGLDAHQPHGVVEEGVEEPDRVRAAAHAGDRDRRQPPLGRQHLLARLLADHRLELAHHQRVGVRPHGAAQQVVGGAHVRHPVANGLVDGVLERARAGVDGAHLGAEQLHAEDVERLPPHVLGPHVDDAFEAEERAHRGGGDAVLAGPGLGDDASLAHAPGQQRLPERGVDLVRAGVRQILALEVEPRGIRAGQPLGQPRRGRERRRPAGVRVQQAVELRAEGVVVSRRLEGRLELGERGHERLGDVLAAELAEAAAGVGQGVGGVRGGHRVLLLPRVLLACVVLIRIALTPPPARRR